MAAVVRDVVRSHVGEMLGARVIEPPCSPWSSPIGLVKKKNGEVRFCIDFRRLNDVTVKDVYPLPRLDDVVDSLGAKYVSTLDLYRGFWQVPVSPEDRMKTVCVTADGLYQFRQMPFGLCNAPASFQRMMDTVLARFKWRTCLVYIDDVVVFSDTFTEHLLRLDEVLTAIGDAGLELQRKKCRFAADSTVYLGYHVYGEGVSPDPAKVRAMLDFSPPTSVTELRRFMGVVSFYRPFVRDFATISHPLTALQKKGEEFLLGAEQQAAFGELVSQLCAGPVLAHPDPNAGRAVRESHLLHQSGVDRGRGEVALQRS